MRARDIMTAPVVVIGPDEPLPSIARLLIEHGISGAPVVDEAGRLVGMVTEADLIALEVEAAVSVAQGYSPQSRAGMVAAEVMTRAVVSVETDAPISEVASLMVERGIRRVPVVERDVVVGIVSRRDVIATLTRSDDVVGVGFEDDPTSTA